MFFDRLEAAKKLGEELKKHDFTDPVVLAIPRGGVIIGIEVAKAIDAELDLVIPRKIGAPGNPELAIGAVTSGEGVLLNENLVKRLDVSDGYIQMKAKEELEEIKRRREKYLGDRESVSLKGKTAIVVDDGLATGYTALASVRAAKRHNPSKVILAVPVAPKETLKFLEKECDEILCLVIPRTFYAVGQFYSNFGQVSDTDVIEALGNFFDNPQ